MPFVCNETYELGEELVGSYRYQVHLLHWLESNVYDVFQSDERSTSRCIESARTHRARVCALPLRASDTTLRLPVTNPAGLAPSKPVSGQLPVWRPPTQNLFQQRIFGRDASERTLESPACAMGEGKSFFDLGSAGVESAGSDRELPACLTLLSVYLFLVVAVQSPKVIRVYVSDHVVAQFEPFHQ